MNKLLAKDIMTSPVLVVKSNEVLTNFLNLIVDHGINGMPVIDEDAQLVGIATKTDLMIHELKRDLKSIYETDLNELFFEQNNEENWMLDYGGTDQFIKTITVTDIMMTNVITAAEDTSVIDICKIMKDEKIDHVVILRNRAITGIITSRDIIRIMANKSG